MPHENPQQLFYFHSAQRQSVTTVALNLTTSSIRLTQPTNNAENVPTDDNVCWQQWPKEIYESNSWSKNTTNKQTNKHNNSAQHLPYYKVYSCPYTSLFSISNVQKNVLYK